MEILANRFTSLHSLGLSGDTAHQDLEIIDYVINNIYLSVNYEKGNKNIQALSLTERNILFSKFLPILEYAVMESNKLEGGFMVARTGYHFMKILNILVDFEPERALSLSVSVVVSAAKNGFTYDHSTLREVITLTERFIVDYKEMLSDKKNFGNLLIILD